MYYNIFSHFLNEFNSITFFSTHLTQFLQLFVTFSYYVRSQTNNTHAHIIDILLYLLFYNSPKCLLSPSSSRLCVSCRTSTDRFRTCTGCSTGCLIWRHTAQRLEARSVPVLGHRRLRPETRRKNKNTVRLSFPNESIIVRTENHIDGFVFIYIYIIVSIS